MMKVDTLQSFTRRMESHGGVVNSYDDKTDIETLEIGDLKATRVMADPTMTWTLEDGTTRKGATFVDMLGRLRERHAATL